MWIALNILFVRNGPGYPAVPAVSIRSRLRKRRFKRFFKPIVNAGPAICCPPTERRSCLPEQQPKSKSFTHGLAARGGYAA